MWVTGEVWAHQTSLTLPLSIEVPILSQESERSCSCVFVLTIVVLSTIFIFDM